MRRRQHRPRVGQLGGVQGGFTVRGGRQDDDDGLRERRRLATPTLKREIPLHCCCVVQTWVVAIPVGALSAAVALVWQIRLPYLCYLCFFLHIDEKEIPSGQVKHVIVFSSFYRRFCLGVDLFSTNTCSKFMLIAHSTRE